MRRRRLRGSDEAHTEQSHPMIGMPAEVPVPRKVAFMCPIVAVVAEKNKAGRVSGLVEFRAAERAYLSANH